MPAPSPFDEPHSAVPPNYDTTAAMRDVATDADGRLLADVSCSRCEYNLRGLLRDGRCPECGQFIIKSLMRREMAFADSAWVSTLARGAWMLIGAIASPVVVFPLAYLAMSWHSLLLVLLPLLLGSYGMFALSTPEPPRDGPPSPDGTDANPSADDVPAAGTVEPLQWRNLGQLQRLTRAGAIVLPSGPVLFAASNLDRTIDPFFVMLAWMSLSGTGIGCCMAVAAGLLVRIGSDLGPTLRFIGFSVIAAVWLPWLAMFGGQFTANAVTALVFLWVGFCLFWFLANLSVLAPALDKAARGSTS